MAEVFGDLGARGEDTEILRRWLRMTASEEGLAQDESVRRGRLRMTASEEGGSG